MLVPKWGLTKAAKAFEMRLWKAKPDSFWGREFDFHMKRQMTLLLLQRSKYDAKKRA